MNDLQHTPADRVTQVIENNGRDLLNYFIRRVSDESDAADLLGNLFLTLWRREDSLPRDPEKARMWCFGIARNVLREHRRKHAHEIAVADSLRTHLSTATHHHITDPADSVAFQEETDHLHTAIRTLDSRSQELITLVHWDGFTLTAAAAHLGMNSSSARTRYSRARQTLALLLDNVASGTARRDTGGGANDAAFAHRNTDLRPNIATEVSHD
jgi:RNA polymerase sigma-70 factor (ECF subfamily)